MAVGDAVSNIVSIAASAYLDLQPAAGVEWIIHNCGSEGGAELYFYDGTNNVLRDSEPAPALWAGVSLHCTNAKYYRIKNTESAAKLCCYDGIQSK